MCDRIPPETLHELLLADYDSGHLWWKARDAQRFSAGRNTAAQNAARWNACHAGRRALTADIWGYSGGTLLRRNVMAHKVLWAMWTGAWPAAPLDHINGVRHDNRIVNLRLTDAFKNAQNARKMKNNTSGVTGVYARSGGRWRAIIHANGERIDLGSFACFEDAAAARKIAERNYGFSERHGTEPRYVKRADYEVDFIAGLRSI